MNNLFFEKFMLSCALSARDWTSVEVKYKEKMSKGVFYHNALSPPSRAALLTIRNLGLEVEVKVIDTYKGEQNTPEYLKINPLHQVPVYVDENFILTESRAISCFLSSTVNSNLYPTDLKKRALVDSRLYFDATNSFPAIKDFAVSSRVFCLFENDNEKF